MIALISEAEFEKLWEKYPRKRGRRIALRHFLASVKTEEDLSAIGIALDHLQVEVDGREMRFVPHGATWFHNWQDYVREARAAEPAAPEQAALEPRGTCEADMPHKFRLCYAPCPDKAPHCLICRAPDGDQRHR